MAEKVDIVVAGAGHNSLVAAAYLAKAGYRCLVLEGRSVLGGNVVTEELTLPGFRHNSCGTAHVILQDSPMMRNDELGLADYGLEYIHPEIVCHAPFLDGSWLTQYHDIERTIEQFAKFSKKDAAAYRRMIAEYDAIKALLLRFPPQFSPPTRRRRHTQTPVPIPRRTPRCLSMPSRAQTSSPLSSPARRSCRSP